jgi:hypothetical protein
MRHAGKVKPKLKDIADFDQVSIDKLAANLPAITLTTEQLSEIASHIPGGLTITQIKADTDLADAISKKHASHSDDQSLSDYVLTNDSRLHASGSDNQIIPDKLSDLLDDITHRTVTDTEKSTWNNKGSSNLILGNLSSNAYPGDTGKIAYDHSQVIHAPSTAQKNSDITKAEIEAKLTGEISSHTHASSGGLTQQQILRLI